jgi:hypothetical protein
MSLNIGVNIWSAQKRGMARDQLQTNRTYYIRSDGSDSNSGLQDTAAGAWLTTQYAANFIARNLDLNSFQVTVRIRAGTYAGIYNQSYVGGGTVYWAGVRGSPSSVTLTNAVSPTGTNLGSMNLLVRTATLVAFNDLTFDPTLGACIDADFDTCGTNKLVYGDFDLDEASYETQLVLAGNQNGGTVIFGNFFDAGFHPSVPSIEVDGSGLTNPGAFLHTLFAGVMFLGSTINFSDAPSFSVAVIRCSQKGMITDFATWSGSPTGIRYQVFQDAIFQAGNGVQGSPGSIDGIVYPGGIVQYTGSDGVFFETFRTSEYIINKTTTPTNLNNNDSGKTYTNTGATARMDFNLPQAEAGLVFRFIVRDVDGIRAIADSGDTIEVGGVASAAGGRVDANVIGDAIELTCINATEWIATRTLGTWTPT